MSYGRIAQAGRGQAPSKPISLNDFKLGLNTVVPPSSLLPNELYSGLNVEFSRKNKLKTRPGAVQYTNTAYPAEVVDMDGVPIGSTFYEMGITSENKLYYLDGSLDPTLIGTLEGAGTITAFSGVAIIMDGSYLKYWDGTNLLLCYDDGSGSTGFQVDQLGSAQDTGRIVGDGTTERVGAKFTTQAWDAGYTIPITRISAYLKGVGSPTGNMVAKVYAVSGGALVSTSTTSLDVSTVSTSAYAQFDFEFPKTDNFSLSTGYYGVVEYTAGDGANHVLVAVDTVASGGNMSHYNGAAWADVTTQDPVIGVQPGRPPKGSYGEVKGSRIHVGGDPDNPGYLWYSNAGTYLDFSTSDGGGFVGAVDDDANNFAVGAVVKQFGNIYVFGTQEQPYLSILTGSTPSDYEVKPLFENVWSTHKLTLSTGNDIWFTALSGAQAMSGVQEFGDIRTITESSSVDNIIRKYFDSDAVGGYNPLDGQYFLKLGGYNRILVAHTKNPVTNQDNVGVSYPWTEFQFTRERLTDEAIYKWTASGNGTNEYYVELLGGGDPSLDKPHFVVYNDRNIAEGTAGSLSNLQWDYGDNDTLGYSTIYIRTDNGDPDALSDEISTVLEPYAFGSWNEKFFVAGDDGHIYYLDNTICRDNGVENRYLVGTAYITPPFGTICLERYSLKVFAQLGADLDIQVFKDFATVTAALTQNLNVADNVTVADLDEVEVRDANFVLTTVPTQLSDDLNINAISFMVMLSNFTTRNSPIFFDGIYLDTRRVGR